MVWYYNGAIFEEAPKDKEAFLYIIYEKDTGQKYIGQKIFWTKRKDPKKGRRVTKESDWANYYGSNETLKVNVKRKGKENYLRIILRLCSTRGEVHFFEECYMHALGVLWDISFYNDNIRGKIFRRNVEKYVDENGIPDYNLTRIIEELPSD